MSANYSPQRSRNCFSPDSDKPFKVSRSKIDDFLKCPRCFYLDRRCGTSHPPSFPFTLNNAVDLLLKKEFNQYRQEKKCHPLCLKNNVEAIPFSHPELENWRMNQKGIQFLHPQTHLLICGAIDDVWINPQGELIIVDYKATSTQEKITLDKDYRLAYKRQMEIYQWLFRKNGFKVSRVGYFVYCNADATRESFTGKLKFDIALLPYEGDDSWIEDKLLQLKECLMSDAIPEPSSSCEYCLYWNAIKKHVSTRSGSIVPKKTD